MIDQKYQKKGFGREAIALGLNFIKSFPCGKAKYCWLSYEPENKVACKLYHSFDFNETGDMEGSEIIAILELYCTPKVRQKKTNFWGVLLCDY